jgi:RNA recognition motif-containing protein
VDLRLSTWINQEEVDAAIAGVEGKELGGRTIYCSPSLPKDRISPRPPHRVFEEDRARKKDTYVGDLPLAVTEEIREIFAPRGPVTDAFIARENAVRDFSVVTFENEEDVDEALQERNGEFLWGWKLAVQKRRPTAEYKDQGRRCE